jgi:SAM-dependent methyltransferase
VTPRTRFSGAARACAAPHRHAAASVRATRDPLAFAPPNRALPRFRSSEEHIVPRRVLSVKRTRAPSPIRHDGNMADRADSGGSGPGAITPDGSSVDFYAQLPAGEEPAIVHGAIPAGASILELGSGTGRVTHPLLQLGHAVVAVDESAEMLARIRGAETVRARIEELDLGRRFDAVLLASHFVNVPDEDERRSLLRACRRHVEDDGCVLIQRHDPTWFDEAAPGERVSGATTFRLRDVSRPAPGLLSATLEYEVGDSVWTQWFTARRVDDAELPAVLAEAGLAFDAYISDDRTWVRAVPGPPAS